MVTNYIRGRNFEYMVWKRLRSMGLLVVRSGGSKKPDFLAVFPQDGEACEVVIGRLPSDLFQSLPRYTVFAVECKKDGRLGADDKEYYHALKRDFNIPSVLAFPEKRGKIGYKTIWK